MQEKVRVSLAASWPEARRRLPKSLAAQLDSHLSLPPGASTAMIVYPNLEFDAADPLVADLLAAAQSSGGKAKRPRPFARHQPEEITDRLVRQVLYYTEYTPADLFAHRFIQLGLLETRPLARPLSQFYRAVITPTPGCEACGLVDLTQTANLRLAEPWPPGVFWGETDNYELLVSDRLKTIWQAASPAAEVVFQPVETPGQSAETVWQVRPQQALPVQIPPTAVQVLSRCPTCQRPLTAYLRRCDEVDSRYQTEALLYTPADAAPIGDFWHTAVIDGRVRLPRHLLENYAHNPEPSYVRPARPFWIISNRLLQEFHKHAIHNWTGKPVLII